MRSRGSLIALVLVLVGFVFGLSYLFRLRLSGGDVFPAYSTLRADPLGTRALYEALAELPDLQVQRWLKPVHRLDAARPQTVILPGMDPDQWKAMSRQDAAALDAIAAAGGRVIVVFAPELQPEEEPPVKPKKFRLIKRKTTPEKKGEGGEPEAEKEKEKKEAERGTPDRLKPADWLALWQIELKHRWFPEQEHTARRAATAPEELPAELRWKSETFFAPPMGAPWRTIYRRNGSPVLVERPRGRGSIVLAADAYFLSNEAMQKDRQTQLLAWLLGSTSSVVFSETHLGVEEDVGIAMLARRYGLTGAFFMLVVLAGLFIWQRAAIFVPPPAQPRELALSYHQTAGLEALLRRSVKPAQLVATCLDEWRPTARRMDLPKVEAALASLDPVKTSPQNTYNALVRALRRTTPPRA